MPPKELTMSDVQKPVDRAVRAKEAASILGIGRSTFFVLMRTEPGFPKGANLGRTRVWLISDLFAWLRKKTNSRNN
jgi:predicted DNA-binding transcriptional regulator AlpA